MTDRTDPIARPRILPRGALACISLAAVAAIAVAILGTLLLGLGTSYPVKAACALAAGAAVVLGQLPRHHRFDTLGAANQVTIVRAALVALLAALLGERTDGGVPAVASAAAAIAAALDAVDGWLARRTRQTSRFGARFDMETDALLILVLSLLAWRFGKAGAWVLLSGLMRYAFVAAGWGWRALRRPLPPSRRRKAVAALQMVTLLVAIAPFTARGPGAAAAGVGLAALSASFLLDAAWLLRHRASAAAVVPAS